MAVEVELENYQFVSSEKRKVANGMEFKDLLEDDSPLPAKVDPKKNCVRSSIPS